MTAAEPPMMKTLRAEHRHMANVLALLEQQLEALEAGDVVDSHVLYETMDYITAWPDRFHHPREDIIYSRVAEVDSEAADEVDTLQRDHDTTARQGRELLADIARWQAGEVGDKHLLKQARAYIAHVFEHMNVEEQVVFPHIESVLSVQDWRDLSAEDSLLAVNQPLFGVPVQREYRRMTRKLRRGTRRAVEQAVFGQMIGLGTAMESMEVIASACATARDSASDHLGRAFKEALQTFRDTPLTAPSRCAVNNVRVSFEFLGDVIAITSDATRDLTALNQERRERLALVQPREDT